MVLGYESDVRKERHSVEDARKKAVEFKAQLDAADSKHRSEQERANKRINDLEAEVQFISKKRKEAEDQNLNLEPARVHCEAKIAELMRMMEAANGLHEINLKQAVTEGRHEMADKFRKKIAHAKGKMVELKDQAKEDMLDLT